MPGDPRGVGAAAGAVAAYRVRTLCAHDAAACDVVRGLVPAAAGRAATPCRDLGRRLLTAAHDPATRGSIVAAARASVRQPAGERARDVSRRAEVGCLLGDVVAGSPRPVVGACWRGLQATATCLLGYRVSQPGAPRSRDSKNVRWRSWGILVIESASWSWQSRQPQIAGQRTSSVRAPAPPRGTSEPERESPWRLLSLE